MHVFANATAQSITARRHLVPDSNRGGVDPKVAPWSAAAQTLSKFACSGHSGAGGIHLALLPLTIIIFSAIELASSHGKRP